MVLGETQSFVVRVWHEATDQQGNVIAWRGSIAHVGTARRLHFQDLEKVIQFIAEEAGIHAEDAAAKERV